MLILIMIVFFNFTLSLTAKNNKKAKKISEKELIKRLPKKYREWLDLVYYIITPQEKKVFLKLTNNKDRDAFIKLFWQMRDPTPGTPENEFKEEHIKRFKYANKYFSFGSPKPGWKTDRGKYYIILGPPVSRDKIDTMGLYPIEIWNYYSKPKWGLPSHFRLVFFRKHGVGDYKLYDPLVDGPDSLLIKTSNVGNIDPFNYAQLYEKIKEIDSIAAEASITLIPGEIPYNFQPSPRNTILIAKINELPKKSVSVSYAEHFLKYKGVVEVDYSMGYIESSFLSRVFYDETTDLYFIYFAIKPKRISLAYSEKKDKYYFAFKLNVSVKKKEKIVYQATKNYSFYFTEDEVINKLKPLGLAIEYMLPLIEGNYKLTVLLQNSVKKEFSFIEEEIKIPAKNSIYLLKPLITYKIKRINPEVYFKPFKFKDFVVHVEPSSEFSISDKKIVVSGVCGRFNEGEYKLKVIVKSKPGYTPFEKEFNKTISVVKSKGGCEFYSFNLPDLPSASYKVTARIYRNNIPLDTKEIKFNVSPLGSVNHPMEASKVVDSKNRGVFFYVIADEYSSLKLFDKAVFYYEKAINSGIIIPEGIINYSKLLIINGKYDSAIKKIQLIKGNSKYEFEYYSIIGEAYLYKTDYKNAIKYLLKANKIYDSDYRVINLLGMAFYHEKMFKEALKAFEASIQLNPEQDEVKRWIDKLKELINRNNKK